MAVSSTCEPDKGPPDRQAVFLQQKYALDRAHELELNRFTHLFEVEQIRLLFLLNGGAFTVLVALVEWRPVAGSSAIFLLLSAFAWLFGLLAAVVAGRRALDVQRAFTQAYHNRRRAVEAEILAPDEVSRREEYARKADGFVERGSAMAKGLPPRIYASVGLFMAGGFAAALYLMVAASAPPASPQSATGTISN